MILARYNFRSFDEENFSDQHCIYFVKKAIINNCDIRATEIYDTRKGKFTGVTFSLDKVNNKYLSELSEEKKSAWLRLFRRINPSQFIESNYGTTDKPKSEDNFLVALDEFMKSLDEVTAFLSIAI